MDKIVNLQEFKNYKKRNIKEVMHSNCLPYDSTDRLRDRFELCSYIISELYIIIENAISKTKISPSEFHMSQKAENETLSLNISELFEGGEALQMTFEAMINGIRYAAVGDATIIGENVSFDCVVVKWNGVEWLAYENGEWSSGPGNDFI